MEILDINYYFLDEIATRSSFFRILSLLYELSLRCVRIFGRSNTRQELKFRFTMVLELTGRVESTGSKHNNCQTCKVFECFDKFQMVNDILSQSFCNTTLSNDQNLIEPVQLQERKEKKVLSANINSQPTLIGGHFCLHDGRDSSLRMCNHGKKLLRRNLAVKEKK